jgi:hypothetical protein
MGALHTRRHGTKRRPILQEKKVPYFKDTRFFNYITSPIIAPSGSISSVVVIMEDITTRVNAEKKIEKFSLRLAEEVDNQTKQLKEKQQKLQLTTNTLYALKQANTIKESIHCIIESLHPLGCKYCIVTCSAVMLNTLQIVEVFPASFLQLLQAVTNQNITTIKFDFDDSSNILFFRLLKAVKKL